MQLEENSRKIAETREFLKEHEGEKTELETKIRELRREQDQVREYEQKIGKIYIFFIIKRHILELKQKEIDVNRSTVSDLIAIMDNKDFVNANKNELIKELNSVSI